MLVFGSRCDAYGVFFRARKVIYIFWTREDFLCKISDMTTEKTHIDVIRSYEEKAAKIIADAKDAAARKIARAREEAQKKAIIYAENVDQVQQKRKVSQEQQLADMSAKMHAEAGAKAQVLAERAQRCHDKVVKKVIQKIIAL